jgi:hypothetical protein
MLSVTQKHASYISKQARKNIHQKYKFVMTRNAAYNDEWQQLLTVTSLVFL